MTQRHFERLAEALASTRPEKGTAAMATWGRTVEAVASVCDDYNPRFKIETFRAWCWK